MDDERDDVMKRLRRAQGPDAAALADLVAEAGRAFPGKASAIRAGALVQELRRGAELLQACGWKGSVTLRDGRVVVDAGGTRFLADPRFFKGGGGSPGKRMLRTLAARRIAVRAVFDVGANIGEIALYFASRLPQARVFAFEPAPENLMVFEQNFALQEPPLNNLQLVREAVSDRRGEIEVTVGGHELNTVMIETNIDRLRGRAEIATRTVPTDTLQGYCERFGVERIDFLKIDIEGGEPLLADSIAAMAGRIGAAYVEISPFNTAEAYAALAAAFRSAGLAMFDRDLEPIGEPLEWITRSISSGAAPNVWFLPPEG
jgi:FkbM family methyltransferase